MNIGRHRQEGRAGEPGNEAAPIGKPDVGAIALTGHGHDLLFGRPIQKDHLPKLSVQYDDELLFRHYPSGHPVYSAFPVLIQK